MRSPAWLLFALFSLSILPSCGGGGGGAVGPTLTAGFEAANKAPVDGDVSLQKNSVTGDTVYLDVWVKGMNNVFGGDIRIDYDSTRVNWGGSYRAGSFLERSGTPNYFVSLDGGEGRVMVGVSLLAPAGTVSGDGALVTLPFKLIALGDSMITISAASKLTDNAVPIPNTLTVNSWDGGALTGN